MDRTADVAQNTAQRKIGVSALRGAELRRELLCLGDRPLVLAVRLSHHVAVRRSRVVVVWRTVVFDSSHRASRDVHAGHAPSRSGDTHF